MSRQIPSRPNLEHLKKQAKDLLAELRQQQHDAQLADAQFRLAREYGFASWAALKTHVRKQGLSGTWRADVSRSMFPPEAERRGVVLRVAVNGDEVVITDVTEDEPRRHHALTLVADGRVRQEEFGYAMTARWSPSGSLEAEVTRNGAPEGRVHYTVTADGEGLMLEHHRAGDTTGAARVAMFDRVRDPSVSDHSRTTDESEEPRGRSGLAAVRAPGRPSPRGDGPE